jgi:hypothetical protein
MSHFEGSELRTFLPAEDFARSVAFYEALGFEKIAQHEVAIFDIGHGRGIIVQQYYTKEWAENLMLSLLVEDLDGWWDHIDSLDLPGRFQVPAPKPPKMQPWGLRVGFLTDPAGVLWHMIQRPN